MSKSRRPGRAPGSVLRVVALLGATVFASTVQGSLRVQHLTPAEGLPNGRVWEAAQDTDGYVWIASSSGVTRYDGRRFRTLTVGDGLPHNTVLSLAADPRSGIWAGTARGLVHIDGLEIGRRVGVDEGLESEVVRGLLRATGALWIGTEKGLYRLDDGSGRPVRVAAPGESQPRVREIAAAEEGEVWVGSTAGLWRTRGGELLPAEGAEAFSGVTVFGVLDHGSRVWAGTAEGLWSREPSGRWRRFGEDDGLPVAATNSIVDRGDGSIWIGTWGAGLVSWTPTGGFRTFGRERGFPLSFVTSLFVDSESNLWSTSYQSGVALTTEHSFDVLGPEQGIPELITRTQEDASGTLWLGGRGGLVGLPEGDASRARPVELQDREVVDLVLDGASNPWIATRSGVAVIVDGEAHWFGLDELGGGRIEDLSTWRAGCYVLTDRSIAYVTARGGIEHLLDHSPVGGNVLSSRAHEDGTLWMASVRGLGKWRPGAEPVFFDEGTGLPANEVRALWVGDDEIWAGTPQGLAQLDLEGRVLRVWAEDEGLPDRHISQLYVRADGDVWVGTERGAALLREERVVPFPAGSGFVGSQVMVFAPDVDGATWVGTDLGLNRCEGDVCEPFGSLQAMEQQPVYQVLRSGPDALWIVTSMGVHFWDGRDLAFYPCRQDLGVRSITRLSALTDSRGRLWVGTDGGVARFESPVARRDRLLPLHLLGLQLDGRRVDRQALDRVLPSETSTLALEFVALSFREPEHVRYEIRWEAPGGEIRTWQTWDRDFVLTGLRPGAHRVTLDARNVSGNRARAPISLAFRIAVPFWQRVWVQVAASLALLLGVGTVVRLRTLSLVRRQQQLEKLVRDRTIALDRANAKLARLATHDELTGLPNHRYFWERAREMRSRARRHGEGFALIIVDLDDFKSVNDRWGHQAGDEVLRRVGAVLGEQVREVDLLARYGGEELAALLSGSSPDAAVRVAERMRSALEHQALGSSGDHEIHVTGSFGVAVWNPDGDSLRGLFRRADVAVYRAKSEGKNRVVLHASQDDDGVLDELD